MMEPSARSIPKEQLRTRKWPTLCVLIGVLSIALGAAHVLLLDGLHGCLFAFLWGHDTVYAQGYSGRRFRQVTRGMTEAEVIGLLGRPLEKTVGAEHGMTVWRYSRSREDDNYRMRSVAFSHGQVAETGHSFYLD